MSIFYPLARISETIKTHLSLGGGINDAVGSELVQKYVAAAVRIDEIATLIRTWGFSQRDMEAIFAASISSYMQGDSPNPCIKAGPFTMIAGSLLFQEPFRLEALLESISARLDNSNCDTEADRERVIYEESVKATSEIWLSHTMQLGEARFTVNPVGGLSNANTTGCVKLVVIVALGILVLVIFMR